MAQATDAITMLLNDHETVRTLLSQLESATGEQKKQVFQQVVHELAVHETAEEEVIYPMLRKDVDGGDTLADERVHEQEEADKLLARMEKLDPAGGEFNTCCAELKNAVLSHARAEEQDVFPRLRAEESTDRLESMGRLLSMAKETAPTHPHPHVPGTATANLVAGPMAAIIDRTRDAFRDARQRLAS